LTPDKYSLWEDIVTKTARFVARDFPEVEEEDLFQDLMLWVLQNKALKNPDAPYTTTGLFKRAVAIAWGYRKQSLYITSQYSYRTSDVRKILETAFDLTEWANGYVPEDAKELSSDDKLIVHADIKRAFMYLSDSYKKSIFLRYALKDKPTDQSGYDRLRRAVEKLTDILNFYPPKYDHTGVGNRRVISNATASYTIQRGEQT
jgi:hypothetical protein